MSRVACCPVCGQEIRTHVNAAFFGGKPYHFSCWIEGPVAAVDTPVAPAPAGTDQA